MESGCPILDEPIIEVEIDPNLFMKCRLCVDNNGSFQIHAITQGQIKYCYDITVKHADNLPQLICKQCKNVLQEYSYLKKKYIENQEKLLQYVKKNAIPCSEKKENDKKNSVDQEDENVLSQNDASEETKKRNIKRNVIFSSSDDNFSDSDYIKIVKVNKAIKDKLSPQKWEQSFVKQFNCRFCDLHFTSKEEIIKHVKTHSNLLTRWNKCVAKHCRISLNKSDNKPNLTGSEKAVVLNQDNVLIDVGSVNYFVTYLRTESKHVRKRKARKRICNTDTSDEETSPAKSVIKQNKKRRRSSNMSTETVDIIESIPNQNTVIDSVIDDTVIDKSAIDTNVNEAELVSNHQHTTCITLDDSSNDKQSHNPQNLDDSSNDKQSHSSQKSTHDIISDIVTRCYRQQELNSSSNKNDFDKILNKKLLSVGRKTFSGVGKKCEGLLKYLEHKNLTVNWFLRDKEEVITNKQPHIVRIMTKMAPIENENDLLIDVNKNIELEYGEDVKHLGVNSAPEINLSTKNIFSTGDVDITETTGVVDTAFTNILLNANPVANPKQLHKKNANDKPFRSDSISLESDEETGNRKLGQIMPVITSTTSLAQPTVARIKCKPTSELLAQPHTNNTITNVSENAHSIQNNSTITGPISALQGKTVGAVICHSVEMPNSLMNPISYFKKLLKMHNIILVTQNTSLTNDFKSLVKFRLDVSQGKHNFVFSSELIADRNCFCLKLRKSDEELDIETLPVNLQIHILKAFNKDVSTKALNCAIQKDDQILFENAKKFVALLNNIEYKRV